MAEALFTECGLLAIVLAGQLGLITIAWLLSRRTNEWDSEWIDRYYDDGRHGPGSD